MIKRILFGGDGGASPLADAGLLIFRVFVGLFIALGHGLSKLPPSEQFVEGVGKLGLPAPAASAWLAAFGEFGGGLLLALGLFTRPAAFLVAATMAVAAFGAHGNDPIFMAGGPAKEPALLYLMPAVLFLFTGAGRYGVDALFRSRRDVIDAPARTLTP